MNGLYNTHANGLLPGSVQGLSGPDVSGKSVYCLEARLLFSAMNVQPDTTRKKFINEFIIGCKLDGTWFKLDLLYLLASHDQQAARLNFISPGKFTLTESSSPSWIVDQGYTGNGVSSYLNTGYNLSGSKVNASLNNCSLGIYSRTNSSLNNVREIGSFNCSVNARNVAGALGGAVNGSNINITGPTASQGLMSRSRTDAANEQAYQRGVQVGTVANASTALDAQTILILSQCDALNAPMNFTTRQVSMAFVGAGTINQLALYNRVQTFLTALGAAV